MHAAYLIAEVGTTFMGSIERAKKLIDAAVDANMDAVKFQVIDPDQDVSKDTTYRVVWGGVEKQVNMREMFQSLVIEEEQWFEISNYCASKNIEFLATCDYPDGILMLERIGINAHKIGAWDANYMQLVECIGATGKPMIVDLGPTTEHELEKLTEWYVNAGGSCVLPLHDFHTDKHAQMNMKAISYLKQKLNTPVGFSSPNTQSELDFVAIAMGANVIEKRLILSRDDHVLHAHESLEPSELKDWTDKIRLAESALGENAIRPSETDILGSQKYYRSIAWGRDVVAGQIIGEDDLCFKRPGAGISPEDVKLLLGKRVKKECNTNELVLWSDVE